MKTLDFWKLCDSLNIIESALLIIGADPGKFSDVEQWRGDKPEGYIAVRNAISRALVEEIVKGNLQWRAEYDVNGNQCGWQEGSLDLEASTVEVESLKAWLVRKGFNSGFFFPESSVLPNYLNKDHPCYSPKLAGAIRAWEAVQTNPKYKGNGKTVKANIDGWLQAHAAEFDLINDQGDAMTSTINEIAKVANWASLGGAPKTPDRNPPAETENPPPSLEATDDGGFDENLDAPLF